MLSLYKAGTTSFFLLLFKAFLIYVRNAFMSSKHHCYITNNNKNVFTLISLSSHRSDYFMCLQLIYLNESHIIHSFRLSCFAEMIKNLFFDAFPSEIMRFHHNIHSMHHCMQHLSSCLSFSFSEIIIGSNFTHLFFFILISINSIKF